MSTSVLDQDYKSAVGMVTSSQTHLAGGQVTGNTGPLHTGDMHDHAVGLTVSHTFMQLVTQWRTSFTTGCATLECAHEIGQYGTLSSHVLQSERARTIV